MQPQSSELQMSAVKCNIWPESHGSLLTYPAAVFLRQ